MRPLAFDIVPKTLAKPRYELLSLLPPMPLGAVDRRILSIREDFLMDEYVLTFEFTYPRGQLSFNF